MLLVVVYREWDDWEVEYVKLKVAVPEGTITTLIVQLTIAANVF